MSFAEKLTTIAENEPKVFNAGCHALENMITNNFERTTYASAFSHTDFTGYQFNKLIKPTGNAEKMFYYYAGAKLPGNISLANINTGVNANGYHDMLFGNAESLAEIKDLNMPEKLPRYNRTFYNCRSLKTILRTINCNENTLFTNTFYNCLSLEIITIDGSIGKDIDLSYSKLLQGKSIARVISNLVDYSGTENEGKYKFSLSAESWNVINKYSYPDPNVLPVKQPGHTWKQYVQSIGWLV